MKSQDYFLISLALFIVTVGQLIGGWFIVRTSSSYLGFEELIILQDISVYLIFLSGLSTIAFAISGLIKRRIEKRSSVP